MINKIKETLGQVFFSPEASGTWEEKIECAIDEVTVKCEDLEAPIQECGPGHFTQGMDSLVTLVFLLLGSLKMMSGLVLLLSLMRTKSMSTSTMIHRWMVVDT